MRILRSHHSHAIDRLLPPSKWYTPGLRETVGQLREEQSTLLSPERQKRARLLVMQRYNAMIDAVLEDQVEGTQTLQEGSLLVRKGTLQAVGERMCHATVVRSVYSANAKGTHQTFPQSIVGLWVTKGGQHSTGRHYDNRRGMVQCSLFEGDVATLALPIQPNETYYGGAVVEENRLNLGRLGAVLEEVAWETPAQVVDAQTFFHGTSS